MRKETDWFFLDSGLPLLLLSSVTPALVIALCCLTASIGPPRNLQVCDAPDDDGNAILVTWELSVDDTVLQGYEIYRIGQNEEPDSMVAMVPPGTGEYSDEDVANGIPYYYYVRAVGEDETSDSDKAGPAVSKAQWFNARRINFLVVGLIFWSLVLWYIRKARRGIPLFIRKIPGLEAVDEAVGRSTEMGRPVLYVSGLGELSGVTTLAALSILGRVAKRTAQYEVRLLVPCTEPLVMTTAQEIVKQSYSEAGRPDLYKESDIFYLTYDQFGYAAGVDGIMLRDRPGAVFLQGYFYAEALILAETGHSIGAIQIAGTTATSQLPFFVAACDYTLIGEEMFAASSYLSKEPVMLGTLKAEDLAKILIVGVFTVTALIATVGVLLEKLAGSEGLTAIYRLIVSFFNTG